MMNDLRGVQRWTRDLRTEREAGRGGWVWPCEGQCLLRGRAERGVSLRTMVQSMGVLKSF